MTQPSHLRPVAPPTDGGDSPNAGRGPQRQRATKALPTDRMKMDRQIAVLRALGRLSGPRKEPVNADALSRGVGDVAATTVILSNKFFVAAGWIENSGKGLYSATDALVEYTRRLATGAADPTEVLRAPARQSWFWEVLEPYLANGRFPVNDAVILLMREADATGDHMPMINNLIAWMEHVGLISILDGSIAAEAGGEDATSEGHPAEPERPADPGARAEAGTQGEEPIVQEGELPPATLIMFGLDVRLTVDDLARLSPEQIKAFFEAVGTLAAVSKG